MKHSIWLTLALCLTFGLAHADNKDSHSHADAMKKQQPQITATEAMKAITVFRRDPTGKDAQAALAVITRFVVKSEEVMVKISKHTVPWAAKDTDLPEHIRTLLTGAFMAGNIEAQLRSHIKGDSPYNGALLVLQVYQLLRKQKKMQAYEPLEQWQKLEAEGKLRSHLEK